MIRGSRIVLSIARQAARAERRRAADERRQQERERRADQQGAIHAKRAAREQARAKKAAFHAAREIEAIDLSERLLDRDQELANILNDTLSIDDTIDFDSLRVSGEAAPVAVPAALELPAPQPTEADFLEGVAPLEGLARLWPGAKERHYADLLDAQAQYLAALDEWHHGEAERQREIERLNTEHAGAAAALAAKKTQRDGEIDEFRAAYFAGDPDAIIAYNTMVLERSEYPDGIPHYFSIAYTERTHQLVIEFELPTVDIVPRALEFTYVEARDEITSEPRKPAEISVLYADVIGAIALRTVHEVYEADQGGHIETVCFNGFVHTVDPATGQDCQPHLVSLRTTSDAFRAIDLARIDKAACLDSLGAVVSRAPAQSEPVEPIIPFERADARFIDQSDLVSGHPSAHNLIELAPAEFEEILADLFDEMGLDAAQISTPGSETAAYVAHDPRPILGGKVVIAARRDHTTVGGAAVRELFDLMASEDASKGILVTTAGFDPDAYEVAASQPIELIDGNGLIYLLDEIGHPTRIAFPSEMA